MIEAALREVYILSSKAYTVLLLIMKLLEDKNLVQLLQILARGT